MDRCSILCGTMILLQRKGLLLLENAYFQKMRTFDRRDISMEGAPVDADSDNGSLPLGGT